MTKTRWAGLRPADTSWRGWFWWGMAYVVAPFLAIVMLWIGGGQISDAWSAAHGGGQLGILHVTSRECSYHRFGGYRCSGLFGNYTSADGATTLHHAFLDAVPHHAGVGSDLTVRWLGERNPAIVYTATGSHEWLLIAALMLAAVITLGVWSIAVYARTHGRYPPWMTKPWAKPPPIRDQRAADKTGHLRRRRKPR